MTRYDVICWFVHGVPVDKDPAKYRTLCAAGLELALALLETCPAGEESDRDACLRDVMNAVSSAPVGAVRARPM